MEICPSSSETGTCRPKGLMSKSLRRCCSLGRQSGGGQTSPVGWVSVRVGMEKEKFLIRAEWMNHRLFRRLLDEAEEEYGYGTKGSLELPCSAEVFNLVLWEVERDKADSVAAASRTLCGFTASPSRGASAWLEKFILPQTDFGLILDFMLSYFWPLLLFVLFSARMLGLVAISRFSECILVLAFLLPWDGLLGQPGMLDSLLQCWNTFGWTMMCAGPAQPLLGRPSLATRRIDAPLVGWWSHFFGAF
ncbi:hypothetical protein IEQ34_004542 [Dendrobium chrysotoxum]|uniref:Uncharacterized protein n=1 Tax=Dendrobium chrysotoxum TaxID=161865 RepID=A0AAV7HGV2_DENCH|nr:hypothetical protein IEQ34_004542 [Dendrobium chrysotoxum]